MRKLLKALLSVTLATVMALSMAMVASAAPAPTKISIKGSLKTMYVGQTYELDSRIRPYDDVVRDNRIIWTSSNPKVLKVLKKRDDDTKVKALKAGTATITVKIKGTTLKATRKITVKQNKKNTISSYEKKIKGYQSSLETIKSNIRKATVSRDYRARMRAALDFKRQIEKIEDKLDSLEDTIEYKYDSGKITWKQYRSLEKKIDKVDDYASDIEDELEYKFGDFDD